MKPKPIKRRTVYIPDADGLPSVADLLRPSMKIILVPAPPRPSGWIVYRQKLVSDR